MKLTKLALIAALVFCCGSVAHAQKFGCINSTELIAQMPESDSIQGKLQEIQQEFFAQLETIEVEYNNKYTEYQKSQATYSDAVRQIKEEEIQRLMTRYQEVQQRYQEEMEKQRTDLMMPIINKAQDAIDKVGKANNFTMIFDIAGGTMVYHDASVVIDIMAMVKKELGIN